MHANKYQVADLLAG